VRKGGSESTLILGVEERASTISLGKLRPIVPWIRGVWK